MSKAMITGTTGADAIQGGLDVMKTGGTACDAALATSMAQVAMAAGSWVSYAGILNMVYFEAGTGKIHDLNGSFNTAKGETDPLSIPGAKNPILDPTPRPSGRTALVPGFMAAVDAAHKRFGALPLSEVFRPAITIADDGFGWNEGAEARYEFRKDVLHRLPATAKIFADKPEVGGSFKQPYLAETLRRTLDEGIREYWYEGEWAEKLVAAVQADGGKMTLSDMTDYEVTWQEPTHIEYSGYDIYAHGLPAEGGVGTAEALNIMAELDFANLPHYSEDPKTLAWLTHLLSLGYAQMTRMGNLDFDGVEFSSRSRVSEAHAVALAHHIRHNKVRLVGEPMAVPAHSDAVVSVDHEGNICAVCHTINSVAWGGTGIFVDGISIPDSASFQQSILAQVGPGKRLPDPTALGVVLRDGEAFVGYSSIGNGLHHHTIGCLHNVLDHGMTPQEAIDAPALGGIEFGPDGLGAQTVGPGDFDIGLLEAASAYGLHFVEDERTRGYWIGIQIGDDGRLHGGSIRALQQGGRAVGY